MAGFKVGDTFPAPGTHAARPTSPSSNPSFYVCTDHNKIYRWDGSAWSDWGTLGGAGVTVQDENGNVATGVTQLDFQGAGVTVTAGTGEVVVTIPGGGSGGGGVIASKSYNPGTTANYAITATTPTDLDATNLAVTFTAPASGSVIVSLSAQQQAHSAGTYARYFWGVREGTTSVMQRQLYGGPGEAVDRFGYVELPVTGLTPGSSHTYKWSMHTELGTVRTYVGGLAGPAVMKVLSA